jgi:hypothetical protein
MRLVVAAFIAIFGLGVVAAAQSTIDPDDYTKEELIETIVAQRTVVAEAKATSAARGQRINAQRTQIAELTDNQGPAPTPTVAAIGTHQLSLSNPISEEFFVPEGTFRADVTCEGYGYGVFLTLQDAPGHDNNIYENLVLGDPSPLTTTQLINIFDSGQAVIFMDGVDAAAAVCTVVLSQ